MNEPVQFDTNGFCVNWLLDGFRTIITFLFSIYYHDSFQDVIRPLTNPFAPPGRHIIILKVWSIPISHCMHFISV